MNGRPTAEDAAAIAAVVSTLPEVARLSGGPVGAVATYGRGRRVVGVRLHDADVELHVVAASVTVPFEALADRIRRSVREAYPAVGHVDVYIDDLEPAVTP